MTPAFWTPTRCLAWLCMLTLVACGEPPADPTSLTPSFHRDGGGDRHEEWAPWSQPSQSRRRDQHRCGRTGRDSLAGRVESLTSCRTDPVDRASRTCMSRGAPRAAVRGQRL